MGFILFGPEIIPNLNTKVGVTVWLSTVALGVWRCYQSFRDRSSLRRLGEMDTMLDDGFFQNVGR